MLVATSTRRHGDFHLTAVPPLALADRRRAFLARPWVMLDEVHGVEVVTVEDPADADRRRGDVAVTGRGDLVLGVWTGDCAPVVLVAPDGRFAVAHAGWRGLAHGVVDRAVEAVDPAAAGGVRGFVGPVIGPCCNEFGAADLDAVAGALRVGADTITGVTGWGTPSLDLPGALRVVLGRLGVGADVDGRCTSDDPELFSHRRGDRARHVTAAWRVEP